MCLLGALLAIAGSLSVKAREPVTLGLDHIPVVVRDLERATATFRALGFSLKPGREHGDGIRNAHVKFPNGSGLELLTVAAPTAQKVDDLSRHYLDLIRAGDGPAFMSLHARNTASLRTALGEAGYRFHADGGSTELERPDLTYLFVVRDNRSPTDRPEHFAHTNGATALSAVWVASENGEGADASAAARVVVSPGDAHGLWIEVSRRPTVVRLGPGSGEEVLEPCDREVDEFRAFEQR